MSKAKASRNRTVIVVNVEIISTKQGKRMKSGIRDRRVDISVLLEIKTKLLARANASALATVFETASKGHRPSN